MKQFILHRIINDIHELHFSPSEFADRFLEMAAKHPLDPTTEAILEEMSLEELYDL